MLNDQQLDAAAPYSTDRTLPLAENRRIFNDEIVPLELVHAARSEEPTAVFVVGQQGAGKTRTGHQIARGLARDGAFADIDSDLYKPYHPDCAALLDGDDRTMAHHTRPDARRWMAQAEAYARGQREDPDDRLGIDVLVQETAQEPAAVVAAIRRYRRTHRIEIAVLALPEPLSSLGVLHRYQRQLAERGHGRLTEPARRAPSYTGILDLAEQVDQHHLADKVAVLRRGAAHPSYANELDACGRWRRPPGLRTALERAREVWTPPEERDFRATHEELLAQMDAEFAAELRDIADRARRLEQAGPRR